REAKAAFKSRVGIDSAQYHSTTPKGEATTMDPNILKKINRALRDAATLVDAIDNLAFRHSQACGCENAFAASHLVGLSKRKLKKVRRLVSPKEQPAPAA